jgi:molecular chaperone HtpG
MQFLERKLQPASFQRIDAGIDETLLDKEREKTILDASGRTEAAHLAEFVRAKLGDERIEVEAKSLASDEVLGVIVIDEGQRRMRDYMLHMDPQDKGNMMDLIHKRTFVVNTNNPMMTALPKIDATDPELATDIVKQAYELALLSQREMNPNALNEFVARSTRVLDKLAKWMGKPAV